MTDLIGGERGFTEDEMYELGDVVADAFLAGLIPGTRKFSRAVLGAGWRKTAEPIAEFRPWVVVPRHTHYFTIGASKLRAGWFGWECSCTQAAKNAYPDRALAFANALRHLPEGVGWHATGEQNG